MYEITISKKETYQKKQYEPVHNFISIKREIESRDQLQGAMDELWNMVREELKKEHERDLKDRKDAKQFM